jgi:hypothetical protein
MKNKKTPRYARIIKFLSLVVPALIFLYLINANILSPHEFNYFYDIGTGDENYLSPLVRISEPVIEESYRNLTSQLVYFNIPIARGSETVNVSVKYLNVFLENQKFSLGARNQENWSYQWNELPIGNKKNSWDITKTTFNISDLYLQNGKLSFVFNVPHLHPNRTLEPKIPIDWINITVFKPGILGK